MKFIVIENTFEPEEFKKVEREIDGIIEDIEKVKDPADFIEDVLEIKRTQSLINGKWETLSYEFMLGFGGPNIYMDTDGTIEYYFDKKLIAKVSSDKAIEKLREIEEWLNEVGE